MKRLFALLALLVAQPATAAYYAEMDENDVVLQVIVVDDALERDAKGVFHEALGIAWCQKQYNGGRWIRAYDDGQRKNYPGPGYIYHPEIDGFAVPQPFASWTLDKATATWIPPTPMPTDSRSYSWDEDAKSWVKAATPK